jgi:hypothetical protein
MVHWTASVVAILLASFPGVVSAQVDCDAVPAGPARTDCYIPPMQVPLAEAMTLLDLAPSRG